MKLWAVCESMDDRYGGPAVSLAELLNNLVGKVDVELLTTRLYGKEVNTTLKRSIIWRSFSVIGPKQAVISINLLYYLLRNAGSEDIIYVNNLWNFVPLFCYIVSNFSGCKIIIAPRGSLFPWALNQGRLRKKIAWRLFQKRMLIKADLVHVTSNHERNELESLGVSDKKILLLHHGVSSPKESIVRKSLNDKFNATTRKVIFMGRLHKKKGLDQLLEMWPRVSSANPKWQLVIAGEDFENYVERIKRINLESVRYVGFVQGGDKSKLLLSAHLFVLPSFTENFGVAIAEALAHGVPVLVSDQTPWCEIENVGCGVFSSISSFENSFKNILSKSDHELSNMGVNGYHYVRNNFDWELLADKFFNKLCLVGDQ